MTCGVFITPNDGRIGGYQVNLCLKVAELAKQSSGEITVLLPYDFIRGETATCKLLGYIPNVHIVSVYPIPLSEIADYEKDILRDCFLLDGFYAPNLVHKGYSGRKKELVKWIFDRSDVFFYASCGEEQQENGVEKRLETWNKHYPRSKKKMIVDLWNVPVKMEIQEPSVPLRVQKSLLQMPISTRRIAAGVIGVNLRKIRQANGRTQTAIAKLLKVSTSLMGQIERGIYYPSDEQLERFANYFDVDMAQILSATDFAELQLRLETDPDYVQKRIEERYQCFYSRK